LPRMIDFYTRVLGLKVTKRGVITGPWISAVVGLIDAEAEFAYLDPPAGGPRPEPIHYRRPTARPPPHLQKSNAPGLRHLAFNVSEIEKVAESLRQAGVRLLSDVQSVPTAQVQYAADVRKLLVYFHDPEGNLLELCEYRQFSRNE